jgi:hypothetical protein
MSQPERLALLLRCSGLLYSFLSACMGSMLAAFCDGTTAASGAADSRRSVAVVKISGFQDCTVQGVKCASRQ